MVSLIPGSTPDHFVEWDVAYYKSGDSESPFKFQTNLSFTQTLNCNPSYAFVNQYSVSTH